MKTDEYFETIQDEQQNIWYEKSYKMQYEQVLGGGFREVREECRHHWVLNMGKPERWCVKCDVVEDIFTDNTTGIDWTSIHLSLDPLFTDEELDFVRFFNSRSG